MKTALIGHTGFVGSNLLAQASWDAVFHSQTIADLAGQQFDLVVCAGAPAAKWLINQNPQADIDNLQTLQDAIGAARIGELVLISTIDVYPQPQGVDEQTPIDARGHHAYGAHRLGLEAFCTAQAATTILRLPGLFGAGLKKNVIYDLLHDNQVDRIDPGGCFQYYDLRHLWADVQRVRKAGVKLVNLATGPIGTERIARELFGVTLPERAGPHASYDMRTRHADLWGRSDGYAYSADAVWADLEAFVAAEQGKTP